MKKEMRDYYRREDVVDSYEEKRFASATGEIYHEKEVAMVNAVLAEQKPEKLLEIAVGPARLAKELTGFKQAVGFDYSPAMLRVAREKLGGNWKLVQGDAFELPFEDEFDCVVSFRFVRHFKLPDRRRLYARILAALKPNGVFIMDAWNEKFASTEKIYNKGWGKKELFDELTENGFEVAELKPYFFLSSLRFLKRGKKKPASGGETRPASG
ncbi:MAG: class I SAM-dependent methyltransferase, partial [Candidatus Micrarchaeota archaeon]